jgi:hypothetical protein
VGGGDLGDCCRRARQHPRRGELRATRAEPPSDPQLHRSRSAAEAADRPFGRASIPRRGRLRHGWRST